MSDIAVLSETECQLGEGPVYVPGRETLYWFDIVECRRHAMHMPTRRQSVVELPEMASGMAAIDDDRDLVLTETGLYVFDNRSESMALVAAVEADNASTRSNDARMHPSGAFWFGTMGKKSETGAGAIYRYWRGAVEMLYDDISIPNAICFSPDGATAYYTDTPTQLLMKVAVDPADGRPVGEPQIFYDHRGAKGGIDGAIVDADGYLWNARWGRAALDRYAPDGSRVETIDLPARQPTCPAFVGENLIAVTSAWQGMGDEKRAADPDAGKTFLLEVPVRPKYEPAAIV